MRPLFAYYGGKQRIAERICELLPPHSNYVEPFAGSGAVLFRKGRPELSSARLYREVLNDTDHRIVNLYRVMQHPEFSESLIERLKYTPYSRYEYTSALRTLELPRGPLDYGPCVHVAHATFIALEQSYSRQLGRAGWSKAKSGPNSRSMTQTWNNARDAERLRRVFNRLDEVILECTDALDCIQAWDSPETCFYLDPPYPGSDQGHYSGYTQAHFERLVAALEGIQGSAVLSCYDNPAVPSHWRRVDIKTHCSAAGRGQKDRTRTEVVWVKPAAEPRSRGAEQMALLP